MSLCIYRYIYTMEKRKLNENETIFKFRKILQKSDKTTNDKYNGILYFISNLESNGKNVFDILQKECQK